ncbi:uncharacterized protein LOC114750453 [Neltuma alba]|uniref:uncharacterized protein LOC114750453 n=1 Tax=Neltuma alba TaxID=207710 RepID=UPI0010A4BE60|nr:uncharacterized protein LOC114750453 [Prosopis alba]
MAPRSRRRLKRRKISPEATQLGSSDGILRLPEHILQHLFFYLPFEDSITLSAVSKTWRSVYKSLPILKINWDFEEGGKTLEDLVASIDKSLSTLRNQRVKIDSFRLNLGPSEEKGLMLKSNLDDWLSLIMKNHVKEINFRVSNNHFTVPHSVFTSKSLVKLHLKGCQFPTTFSLIGNDDDDEDEERKSWFNSFNCLKEIFLVNVVVRGDQIQELINLARNFLEKLRIKTYPPLQLLSLESFSKLGSFEGNVRKVYINKAVNLQKVVADELKRAYIFRSENIKTLRCLKWNNSPFRTSIQALVSSLPLLETLQLSMFRNQRIKIQSEPLKRLMLSEGERFEQPLAVDLDAPGLRKIYFKGSSIPFVTVYGENQQLRCRHLGGLHGSHLHMIGRFSQNLMQSMVTIHLHQILLVDKNGQNVVKNLEELREEREIPRPSSVKMLVLECIPNASDYSAFLNALFWTCHPRTLLVLLTKKETLNSPHRPSFISYLVNELSRRRDRNPTCCLEPDKPRCWKHYVAQIRHEDCWLYVVKLRMCTVFIAVFVLFDGVLLRSVNVCDMA